MKFYCADPELKQLYRKHADDAGFDICASEEMLIEDHDWHVIKTGLHVAIPKRYVGIVKPRSGLSLQFNTDIHAGVIDASYRGEIRVLISALQTPFKIEKGDRIAQLCVLRLYPGPAQQVSSLDELEETERGSDGFGSTGGY